ncbi:MAG TPA: DNA repair protein RadC [Candidatus Hydrogenedentes bacterium]|nr:DNA repair protein RadC [Candidatus Hydrogenedentota bacterium]
MDQPQFSTAVRELPPEERPRERLLRLGPEALKDAELIAVIIRSGTRDCGAVALAERVVQRFKDLRGVSRASIEELRQVKGLGEVKAVEIKAALELGKRLAKHIGEIRTKISSAEDVSNLLMTMYKDCEIEIFKAILLNPKNEVLNVVNVSSGSLDASVALPREVFRQAVREGAVSTIVCHNHPSGDPEPSRADIALTRRLVESGELIGISLLDHIVFGDGRYVSLKERNLM